MQSQAADLVVAPRRAWAFLLVGAIGIVAGGLVAAIADPLHLEHGSWAAAYLVLVVGVAQIGLGVLQERLAVRPTGRALRGTELAAWNVGNVAVIAGTLAAAPFVVDAGGLLLVLALALFLAAQRQGTGIRSTAGTRGTAGTPGTGAHETAAARWAVWSFRGLVILLLISIPVGLILAHLRA